MSPILEQLSEEKQDVVFAKIDVDDAERLAILYGISSIPCMILFKNGEEADRVVGAVPKQKLEQVVSA
jgi:thioredoxin 1